MTLNSKKRKPHRTREARVMRLVIFLWFSSTLLSYSHSCFFHKNSPLHKPSEINSLSHYKISHFKSHTNPLVFWVSILTVTRHLSLSLSLSLIGFLENAVRKRKRKYELGTDFCVFLCSMKWNQIRKEYWVFFKNFS